MKKVSLSIIVFLLAVFPLLSPPKVSAAVGDHIDYTNLWRGYNVNKPGMDAGTIHKNKPEWLCTPQGFKFKLLCGPATESFLAMNEAFKKEFGHNMPVGGGYRTKEAQQSGGGTFAEYKPNNDPPEHLWGSAIDFDTGVYKTGAKEQKWTAQNGPKYGWFWPNWAREGRGGKGGYVEPWHFAYYHIGHDPSTDKLDNAFTGIGPDGAGNSTVVAPGNGQAVSNCVITKVGNPIGQPILPPQCTGQGTNPGTDPEAPAGDAQELARQVLKNKNIQLQPRAKKDLQRAAEGKGTGACNNAKIQAPLMRLMLQLAENHTYMIGYLDTDHTCNGGFHPKGRAMDLWSADGKDSWRNTAFRQDIANLLPEGGGLGQLGCPGSAKVNPKNNIRQFDDSCNHQHVDVGAQSK